MIVVLSFLIAGAVGMAAGFGVGYLAGRDVSHRIVEETVADFVRRTEINGGSRFDMLFLVRSRIVGKLSTPEWAARCDRFRAHVAVRRGAGLE